MRYWVRKINAKGVLLLCLTTHNLWRYVFRTKRLHEPLLSQWIMHPNPTHIFSSSPYSLHKSHKFVCIFFFQKTPTKQGVLNLFKYLDFKKGRTESTPSPAATSWPKLCILPRWDGQVWTASAALSITVRGRLGCKGVHKPRQGQIHPWIS